MRAEQEASFLRELNQNIGIVHCVCRTYFRRNPLDYEDVFQDILYQLWKSYPNFKGGSKFSTWMYRVALNTAIASVRRVARAPRGAELTESIGHSPHVSESRNQRDEIERLYRAIETLTAVDKAIVLLHLEDHSYEEIASITGLTRTNVSVRLVRIKRTLNDRLQGN